MVKNNKKAISPVVATALLLVVAVVAVVGFQTWFNTYQSGLNVKVEEQSDSGGAITIERVEDDGTVYLKNSASTAATITSVAITGTGTGCPAANQTALATVAANTVKNTTPVSCTLVEGETASVVVVTPNGVVSGDYIVR